MFEGDLCGNTSMVELTLLQTRCHPMGAVGVSVPKTLSLDTRVCAVATFLR